MSTVRAPGGHSAQPSLVRDYLGMHRVDWRDAAANDFLLRRARLIIAGQFNENIGFLVDTEVSYGAISNAIGVIRSRGELC